MNKRLLKCTFTHFAEIRRYATLCNLVTYQNEATHARSHVNKRAHRAEDKLLRDLRHEPERFVERRLVDAGSAQPTSTCDRRDPRSRLEPTPADCRAAGVATAAAFWFFSTTVEQSDASNISVRSALHGGLSEQRLHHRQ